MQPRPEAIIDTLNGLLEAEVNSVFCFVMTASPYMGQAPAQVRTVMTEMDQLCHEHRKELANLIESLGGVPRARSRVPDEEQYLSYLSLKFLIPKLVVEKDLLLTRFENAQANVGNDHPQVTEFLNRVVTQQRHYLELLKKNAVEITQGKYEPREHGVGEKPKMEDGG